MSHEVYLWVKSFHISAVIFWMAGLLYLPRLMVYHVAADQDTNEVAQQSKKEMLQQMQTKLLKIIMTPAMMTTWGLGISLIFYDPRSLGVWFLVKFGLVVLLSAFHFFLAKEVKLLAEGQSNKSENFFRKINEVPAFIVVLVVIMVIVRPI